MNERRVVTDLAARLRADAPESEAADRTGDPLGDPAVGWPELLDCAAAYQLLPALWTSLTRAGVRPLPAVLRDRAATSPLVVLEDAYRANAARVEDLSEQGHDVLGALYDAGIPSLPIKGLHGLVADWWADSAARVMVDIDVLVPEARIDDAAAVVAALGYRSLGTKDPEGAAAHQRPALGRPGRAGSLELHTAPLVLRRAALMPAADLFAGADVVSVGGRALQVPDATHAMVLAIAHAQLQDDGARLLHLPLRALADVAGLVARGVTDTVDWREVSLRFAQQHSSRALAGFAVALEDLFDASLAVPRRDGRAWLAATWWATNHPRAAQSYRELVTLPRALSASRMERLYRAHTVPGRTVARVRHVGAGVRRRLGRPQIEPAAAPVKPLRLGAYVMTIGSRAAVLEETLANLASTDWSETPVVILDQELSPDPKIRVPLTGQMVLEAGAAAGDDLFVFLEDDLDFNRSLRHNLERWPPIVAHVDGAHFFGSLYNPNLVPLDADRSCTFAIVDPEQVYGSQAWVLSRATARFVLEHWDEVRGFPDIRISRLAGRVTPLYYHLPSLVQHRPVPSGWGGTAHAALDYDPSWRAADPSSPSSPASTSVNRAATTGPA